MPDYELLQESLDRIVESVEWAAVWIEYLEREERARGTSDLDILKADLRLLRMVADALVPGRVRDTSSDRRWYLAPDETAPREQELLRGLDQATRDVEFAVEEVEERRRAEDRNEQKVDERRKREPDKPLQRQEGERKLVFAFLRENGPSTIKEIAAGTGLNTFVAGQAAKAVAKRRQGQRFVIG